MTQKKWVSSRIPGATYYIAATATVAQAPDTTPPATSGLTAAEVLTNMTTPVSGTPPAPPSGVQVQFNP